MHVDETVCADSTLALLCYGGDTSNRITCFVLYESVLFSCNWNAVLLCANVSEPRLSSALPQTSRQPIGTSLTVMSADLFSWAFVSMTSSQTRLVLSCPGVHPHVQS